PMSYHPYPCVPQHDHWHATCDSPRTWKQHKGYPNLLSEKQAAKRLGIARITLLRAREAGRIRFFRIGTRVLYCAEHLTEFLSNCESNHRRTQANVRERVRTTPRKENVSSGR